MGECLSPFRAPSLPSRSPKEMPELRNVRKMSYTLDLLPPGWVVFRKMRSPFCQMLFSRAGHLEASHFASLSFLSQRFNIVKSLPLGENRVISFDLVWSVRPFLRFDSIGPLSLSRRRMRRMRRRLLGAWGCGGGGGDAPISTFSCVVVFSLPSSEFPLFFISCAVFCLLFGVVLVPCYF